MCSANTREGNIYVYVFFALFFFFLYCACFALLLVYFNVDRGGGETEKMRRTWPARCAANTLAPAREMERRLRSRDMTLRVTTKDGTLRLVYASTLGLLRETLRRHRLAARTHGCCPFLELLGTHLSFTNILAALQEGEERVSSRFTADEATVVTEALALGECRCCVRGDNNGSIEGPSFPLIVERALYGRRQAFTSATSARFDRIVSEDEEEINDADAMST
ncbi:hypothetical protein, conserved, partial [Trypanosoma cruzi]